MRLEMPEAHLTAPPATSLPWRRTAAGWTAGLYLVRIDLAKTYLKCELRRGTWTGGYGTDVRAKDMACSKWWANDA